MPKLHVNKVRTVCGASVGDRPITVGRSSESDIVLPHRSVSRHHCVIESDGSGGLRLRDLESHYGTKVNGQTVTEVDLCDGDVIGVGPYEITVDEANLGSGAGGSSRNGHVVEAGDESSTIALERVPGPSPDTVAMEEALAAEREALERLRTDLAEQQSALEARQALMTTPSIGDLAESADDPAPAVGFDDRLSTAEDRLADALARTAAAEERADAEQARCTNLEAQLEEERARATETAERLATYETDRDAAAEDRLADALARAAAAEDRADAEQARSGDLEGQLEAQLQAHQTQATETAERLAAIETERDETAATLASVKAELDSTTAAATTERQDIETRAAETLSAELAAAAALLAAEQARAEAAETTEAEQRSRADDAEAVIARMETERDEAARAAESARHEFEHRIAERDKELTSQRDEQHRTERDLDTTRRKLEKTLADVADLGARLADAEARLRQSQQDLAESDQVLERIKQLRREMLESSHEVSAAHHNVDALEAMWLETDEHLADSEGEMDPVLAMRRETIANRLEEAHEDRDAAIMALQEAINRLCEIETPVREGLVVRRRSRFNIGGLLGKD